MNGNKPDLKIVHSQTPEELQREQLRQRLFDALSNRMYNWGTWDQVIEHRARMLEHSYHHPDIPETDIKGRMKRLKEDILEALRKTSILRAQDFPHGVINECLKGLALATVVEDFAGERISEEAEELIASNRKRHFRKLVDELMRKSVVCHMEALYLHLHEMQAPVPGDSDLTWLAIAELNENRVGAALPRVLVLPNFYKCYNPFFVLVDESIDVPAPMAEALRLFFSR